MSMSAKNISLIVAVGTACVLAIIGAFIPETREYVVIVAKALLAAVPGLVQ